MTKFQKLYRITTTAVLFVIFSITSTAQEATMSDLKLGKNSVTIHYGDEKIAANVFLPEGYNGGKLPTIVFSAPATGVKEQTVGLYAEKLANKGFLTVAFDPRGWGESTGRRFYFNPTELAEDIKTVTNYVRSLDIADTDNSFNAGICMGAAFAAYATGYDSRIKALAVVSPYVDAAQSYIDMFDGSSAKLRNNMLAQVNQAKEHYYATKQDIYVKIVPETKEEYDAAPTDVARGMAGYYLPGKLGNVANWNNQMAAAGVDTMIAFNIFNYLHMLEDIPTFVAYGTEAVTADGAKKFYDQINAPKEQHIIEGAGHFELYWKPEFVNPTVDLIAEVFRAQM